MKKLLLALALLVLPNAALAQCNGIFANNTVCGNVTGASNLPRPTNPSAFLGAAGGTNGQIQYNNAGALGGFTMSGDATTNTSTGILSILKSGNTNTFVTYTGATTAGACVTFDGSGNLVISANPCFGGTRVVTTNATILTSDCGKTVQIGTGTTGFFTFTLPAPAGFVEGCRVTISNGDTWADATKAAKALSGFPTNIVGPQNMLWPLQSAAVQIINSAWTTVQNGVRPVLPNGTVNVYTNFSTGNDVNDCLVAARACKTAQRARDLACQEFSFNTAAQTIYTINTAAAINDTQGAHFACHATPGAQGGAAINVVCGAGGGFVTVNTDAFAVEVGDRASIAGCVLQGTGTVTGIGTSRPADGLRADFGGVIFNGGNTFALAAGSHIAADNGGLILMLGNNITNNSALTHYYATNGGKINTDHVSILLTDTIQAGAAVVIGSAWASAGPGGVIDVPSVIFPLGGGASVTGVKALTNSTGTISTGAGTANCNNAYFPGTVNGAVAAPFCS